MQKVKRAYDSWTEKEDAALLFLYSRGIKPRYFSQHIVTDKVASQIYSRALLLRKKGLLKKAEVAPKAIHVANYSNKLVKRRLEERTSEEIFEANAGEVEKKGGWFGIPGPAIAEHYIVGEKNMREGSPFLAVERDTCQLKRMRSSISTLNIAQQSRIKLAQGDLFEVLERLYPNTVKPRVPLFSYGHLDFCKSSKGLANDRSFKSGLCWLANWKQLKDTFYLDFSCSVRPFPPVYYEILLQQTIPNTFFFAGWKVEDPRDLERKFILEYRESKGNPMVNALYKMTRLPKLTGRPKIRSCNGKTI